MGALAKAATVAASLSGLALVAVAPAKAGSLSNALTYEWAVMGGSPISDKDEADGNAIDSTGAVIATGIFMETARFGPDFELSSNGDGDIFVMKYERDGSPAWIRQFGGSGNDNAFDLAVDRADNIIVSGWFSHDIRFGEIALTSRGGTDGFVAKLTGDGDVLWVVQMGGGSDDGGNEVATDADGNILATAGSEGEFRVGDLTFRNHGRQDAFALKFDAEGRLIWALGTEGAGVERIRAIAADGPGNVYAGYQVRGDFRLGELIFGGAGGWDGVALKLAPDGRVLWASHIATAGEDGVNGAAGGRDGSAYFAGAVGGRTTVGDLPIENYGERSNFVFKLSPDARAQWVDTFADSRPGTGFELFARPQGGVLVSGIQAGAASVRRNGRELVTLTANTRGRTEATVMLLSEDGDVVDRLGPSASDASSANTCHVGPDGETFVQSVVFRGDISYGDDRFSIGEDRNFLLLVGSLN